MCSVLPLLILKVSVNCKSSFTCFSPLMLHICFFFFCYTGVQPAFGGWIAPNLHPLRFLSYRYEEQSNSETVCVSTLIWWSPWTKSYGILSCDLPDLKLDKSNYMKPRFPLVSLISDVAAARWGACKLMPYREWWLSSTFVVRMRIDL